MVPQLKIKPKCCHFDTTEVMEAESQAVMNTLTEHDFQDAFELWQKQWERCIRAEGTRWQHQSEKLWMTLCIYSFSI
jgi:hypothetical protein